MFCSVDLTAESETATRMAEACTAPMTMVDAIVIGTTHQDAGSTARSMASRIVRLLSNTEARVRSRCDAVRHARQALPEDLERLPQSQARMHTQQAFLDARLTSHAPKPVALRMAAALEALLLASDDEGGAESGGHTSNPAMAAFAERVARVDVASPRRAFMNGQVRQRVCALDGSRTDRRMHAQLARALARTLLTTTGVDCVRDFTWSTPSGIDLHAWEIVLSPQTISLFNPDIWAEQLATLSLDESMGCTYVVVGLEAATDADSDAIRRPHPVPKGFCEKYQLTVPLCLALSFRGSVVESVARDNGEAQRVPDVVRCL